jgi:hypothetical protein
MGSAIKLVGFEVTRSLGGSKPGTRLRGGCAERLARGEEGGPGLRLTLVRLGAPTLAAFLGNRFEQFGPPGPS